MSLMAGQLHFRILGELEALRDSVPVHLRGARPRALLAFFVLHANEQVATDQIIRSLWAEPPKAARPSIQVFVHQIRQALGGPEVGKRVLRTVPDGYQLQLQPGQADVQQFQQLVADARHDHASGRRPEAWERFGQALELWRGPALLDFADEPFVVAETARLDAQRLAAVEARAQVGLELGRHAELVGDLEALTRSYPARAELHALRMLALYRSDRQAEALDAYQSARRSLAGPPGARLEQLQRAILSHDPSLDLAEPPSPASSRTLAGERAVPARPPLPPAAPPPARVREPAPARRREDRKLVTVLVAGLTEPDGDGDPEDTQRRQDAAAAYMSRCVQRYGGVVQAVAAGSSCRTPR